MNLTDAITIITIVREDFTFQFLKPELVAAMGYLALL